MSSTGKKEIASNIKESIANENSLSLDKKNENSNSAEKTKGISDPNNFPVANKRDTNNTASTRLSHYLAHNIVYSITPTNDKEKHIIPLNLDSDHREGEKKDLEKKEDVQNIVENKEEKAEKDTQNKEFEKNPTQEESKELVRAIIKPVAYKNSKQIAFQESVPERIIVVRSPVYTPVSIQKMKQVRILEQPIPTIIKRLPPQIIKPQGPTTLSLIRTTPQIRPFYIASPQRILITPIQTPVIQIPVQMQPSPVMTNSLPPPFFPSSYPSNFHQSSLPNFSQSYPPSLPSSFPQTAPQTKPFTTPRALPQNFSDTMPPNFPEMNPPVQKQVKPKTNNNVNKNQHSSNQNKKNKKSESIQPVENKSAIKKKASVQKPETPEREPSPFILFHDRDDDDNNNGKGSKAENKATTNETPTESESRQGNKSRHGKNKLDFIANLFDGYYYTNIDYNKDYQNNNQVEEENVTESIKPLSMPKNNRLNSLSNNLANGDKTNSTLPKIGRTSETPVAGNQSKMSVNRKSISNENPKRGNAAPLQSIYTNQTRKNGSKSKLDQNETSEILPTPNKKNSDSESKRINYPRNSVFAK